jgi:hypothetical protein
VERQSRVLDVSALSHYSRADSDHHRNEVESYVRRNQPEGSRASNPAPTQTVTEPPASAAFTDARKSGATDLQTLKDAYFAKERLEASQRKAKGPAKD